MAKYGISEAQFREYLEQKVREAREHYTVTDTSLEGAVAQILLDEGYDDLCGYTEGLLTHGCVSAWVSALIWFSDTQKFFNDHVLEISELVTEIQEETGESFPIVKSSNIANDLAWLAMEEITHRFACDSGLL